MGVREGGRRGKGDMATMRTPTKGEKKKKESKRDLSFSMVDHYQMGGQYVLHQPNSEHNRARGIDEQEEK